jgi:dolichyl-phosphate-mannose-protein mannosyltransferase
MRSAWWLYVVAGVVVGAGAVVRFHHLGTPDFDAREVAAINSVDRLRHPQIAQAGTDGVPLPVPYAATRVAMRWGYAEGTLRLPGAIAGTATLPAVWWIGQAIFGPEAALYATALLATSALHVGLSRSVDAEAWLTLWTALTVLVFSRASTATPAREHWILFAAVAAVMALSGYAGLLVLIALAGYATWAGGRSGRGLFRPVVFASLLAAIPLGGWAFFNPPQIGGTYFGVQFGWRLIGTLIETLASTSDMRVAFVVLALAVVGAMAAGRPVSVIVTWAAVGVGGVVLTDWLTQGAWEPEQLGFVLPAYCLLAGLGLSRVRAAVAAALVPRRIALQATVPLIGAALLAVLAMDMPALAAVLRRQGPSWHDAAAAVMVNARPEDRIVALHDRTRFVFSAPELERRVPPLVPPARATSYFVRAPRAWFIVPPATRLYPGWPLVTKWMTTVRSVRLDMGGGLDVFYLGRVDRQQLLTEVAYFTLPTPVLVRGSLLLDLLLEVGPLDQVLWKVDQIALSHPSPELRNPVLLQAVYFLAQHEHGDRAASLAYRLATADPAWAEARAALAAFQPNSSGAAANTN